MRAGTRPYRHPSGRIPSPAGTRMDTPPPRPATPIPSDCPVELLVTDTAIRWPAGAQTGSRKVHEAVCGDERKGVATAPGWPSRMVHT